MTGPMIGSLFSGYGGLDYAVQAVVGGELAWVSDIDPGACKILAHRHPDVPNLGDITTVDWTTVPRVDVLTGGSPCQDLSHAGRRGGMTEGTRSNLWVAMREAIAQLRPSLVVWENVRGAYTAEADSALESDPRLLASVRRRDGQPVLRAAGRVVGDLSDLGYVGGWVGLPASSVGAPHGRFRMFLAAANPGSEHRIERWVAAASGQKEGWRPLGEPARRGGTPPRVTDLLPTPRVAASRTSRSAAVRNDSMSAPSLEQAIEIGYGELPREFVSWDELPQSWQPGDALLPTPTATDVKASGASYPSTDTHQQGTTLTDATVRQPDQWGKYAAAIARWERIFGRPAPSPTEPNARGNQRLSPRFVEWMMGLAPGHVTDVPGVTRNEALKLCGNGVVPLQAAVAVRYLLSVLELGVAA